MLSIIFVNYSLKKKRLYGHPTRSRGGRSGGVIQPYHSFTVDPIPTPSPSTPNIGTLNKYKLETLCRLMSQLEPPTAASSSFAHSVI
jgi:hypothetical protein